MAEIRVDRNEVVVRLDALEALVSLRRLIRVPVSKLRMVHVEELPMSGLALLRLPGLAWPGAFAIGESRKGGRREFAAVYARKPAVVIDAEGAAWERLIVSQEGAAAVAAELAAMLLGRAPGKPARRGALEAPLD